MALIELLRSMARQGTDTFSIRVGISTKLIADEGTHGRSSSRGRHGLWFALGRENRRRRRKGHLA
jgi:hypothetical protein